MAKLIKATKENDIEPRYLEIELTESAVYDEMERLLDMMYLIKEAGFGLSMDDFGSGYSSLHLPRHLPGKGSA
nr:EAL domain-containing protein [Lachnospiraceae bacterium]